MAPHIVQTGTYSSWNKGDAAMQLSLMEALRRRWPEVEVTVTAPFPANDRRFYEGLARVVACHRRRLIFASLQMCRAAMWRTIRKTLGADASWLILDEELKATRDADLVVDLSGDMLTDDYGPHVAYSHYIPIINALLLDRPVFVCAQSIGPFRWTGALASRVLRRVDAITVRDDISLEHLRAIGVPEEKVRRTADLAFLLEPVGPDVVSQLLVDQGIVLDDRPLLGVSLSRILEKRHDASARRRGQPPFVRLLAETLDRFARTHDVQILFVPHVTGPTADKDDRQIAREVAAAMTTPAHCLTADLRPEQLKGVIAGCSLVAGARMHANIAALSSGVPVVALSYSHKTPGIMALFEQQAMVLDGSELTGEALFDRLEHALASREPLAARLREIAADTRRASEINLEIIGTLLRGSGDKG